MRLINLPRLLMVACVLLAGCVKQDEFPVSDYVKRLARSLDMSLRAGEVTVLPRYPRGRDLQFAYPEASMDLLEFLSIGECELQQVVAMKNSSLGRLALPSQRLVYELEFLRVGKDCINVLQAKDPELAARLEAVMASKREALPARTWEATLGGPEFRKLWSASAPRVAIDPQLVPTLKTLLSDIDRWLTGDFMVDAGQLEENLSVIAKGGGGGLLSAWRDLADVLGATNENIHREYSGKQLCYPGMESKRAQIFRQVVTRYFLQGLQREIAVLSRQTFELMPLVQAIEVRLGSVEPDAYAHWRSARDGVVVAGRRSVRVHVDALRPLMAQCGFLPG